MKDEGLGGGVALAAEAGEVGFGFFFYLPLEDMAIREAPRDGTPARAQGAGQFADTVAADRGPVGEVIVGG